MDSPNHRGGWIHYFRHLADTLDIAGALLEQGTNVVKVDIWTIDYFTSSKLALGSGNGVVKCFTLSDQTRSECKPSQQQLLGSTTCPIDKRTGITWTSTDCMQNSGPHLGLHFWKRNFQVAVPLINCVTDVNVGVRDFAGWTALHAALIEPLVGTVTTRQRRQCERKETGLLDSLASHID
jgi:hypothetical protein